jgi:hypothetical protein
MDDNNIQMVTAIQIDNSVNSQNIIYALNVQPNNQIHPDLEAGDYDDDISQFIRTYFYIRCKNVVIALLFILLDTSFIIINRSDECLYNQGIQLTFVILLTTAIYNIIIIYILHSEYIINDITLNDEPSHYKLSLQKYVATHVFVNFHFVLANLLMYWFSINKCSKNLETYLVYSLLGKLLYYYIYLKFIIFKICSKTDENL